MHTATRRAVLGAGAAALLAATGEPAGALARAVASSRSGVAREVDADFDGRRDVRLSRTAPPGASERETVLLASSDGESTSDYAASLVTVRNEGLTLADLAAGGFGYDFYAGAANTSAAPDEAWIVLHSDAAGRRGRHAVFRTEDFGAAGAWHRRTVSEEVTGSVRADGTGQEWKQFHPGRRSVERVGTDLVARYGGDADVVAVGVGRGTPLTSPSVIETYYDGFEVDGTERTLPVTRARGRPRR